MTNLNVITHRDTLQQLNDQIDEKSRRIDQLKLNYNRFKAQLNTIKREHEEFTMRPFILLQDAGSVYRQTPTPLQESQRKVQIKKDLDKAQKDFDSVAPEFEQLQAELSLLRDEREKLEAQQPTATTQEYDAAIESVKSTREQLEKIKSVLKGLESKDVQQLKASEEQARAELDALSADLALGLAKPEQVAKAKQKLQVATQAHAEALGANVDLEAVKRGLDVKLGQAQQEHDKALNNAKAVVLAHRDALDHKTCGAIAKKLSEIDRIVATLRQSDLIRTQLGMGAMYFGHKIVVKGFGQDDGTAIEVKISETEPDDAIMDIFG